jgi:hypothetical protein
MWGPFADGSWLDNWGTESGAQRWRPFVGDFYGPSAASDDVGVYAANAGRWFIANNAGSSFSPVWGPDVDGSWKSGFAIDSYSGQFRTH